MARLLPSPSLDAWHSSLGGRVHLSPCVSLHLSPVVSPPGCLARLSGWTRSFVSLGSLVSLCLPSFVSRCLPAWMIQSGWTGSFVSLCHLSPVVSQPGCLARLSGWTGSFVSLCLPSFVSQPGCLARLGFICLPLSPFICLRCLPAWMPGAALWVDGFICLPLSPRMSGTPLFPFICLPLSPSLDAWHCFFGGQIHFSPFVSLHLAPVVSQPGCLSRLSRRTDSLVSLGSPSFVSHLCGWTDSFVSLCLPLFVSFVSLCLPLFVSRCLPAWMPGTALWVDGFICHPLSPFICLPLPPSLDAWHGAVTGIQAGRQPGPNKGRQRETNESVRQMKGEEPVRRESRDNPRCQEHHWVSRRRFVEHHQRIDRRFNSSVIHVCFTGGLTEPSRS